MKKVSLATALEVVGAILVVAGLAVVNIAAALVVAGVAFLAFGLASEL